MKIKISHARFGKAITGLNHWSAFEIPIIKNLNIERSF